MVLQNSIGQLPWAGQPFTNATYFPFSFTYHHYTLLDLYNYYIYTGDMEYLKSYWDQYKFALSWSLSQIDASGFANVTSPNDWLRYGMGGHNGEVHHLYKTYLDCLLIGARLTQSCTTLSTRLSTLLQLSVTTA